MRPMPPLIRWPSRLILCVCAAGGFVTTAALLHHALPLQVAEVTPKLDYLKSHPADFDTVFIGSSRIYHGVSPRAFDAAMAAAGRPTHSFNLAVDGMMPPESLQMARTMLAMPLPHLRTVFLEVASAQPLPDANNLTARDIYAQDPRSLLYGFNRALQDFRTLPQDTRWQRLSDDIAIATVTFTRNELSMGRLVFAADSVEPPKRLGSAMLGPDSDGFVPERAVLSGPSRAKLARELETILTGTVQDRPQDPLNEESYAAIRDLLTERRIELILITAPVALRDFHARVDAPPGTRLLAFDEPGRYRDLYTPDHRADSDHLNYDGARIFSKYLALSYLTGQ
jgi:hypothetical protein